MTNRVKLPIWAVTPHSERGPPVTESSGGPRHVLAFSTSEPLVALLGHRWGSEWNLRLIQNDGDLLLLVADLHACGIKGIHLDPNPDGTGGTGVQLDELMLQIDPKAIGRIRPVSGG
jgi:hypothetical protein